MLRFRQCSNLFAHDTTAQVSRPAPRPARCKAQAGRSSLNGRFVEKEQQPSETSIAIRTQDKKSFEQRGLYDGRKITDGYLEVSHGHTCYYQIHGNLDGPAALFLHGGPGAGCFENHARFFDPSFWKIVLFDQRGCGKSMPTGSLEGNTTQNLVADIEALRVHLNVQSWTVMGGSWGVTLALAYATAHPSRVSGMVLRGLCTMREKEIDWMYRGGAGAVFPDAWERFLSILSDSEKADPLTSYYKHLTSNDLVTVETAANYWRRWEMSVMFSGQMSEEFVLKNGEVYNSKGERSFSTSTGKASRGKSGHKPQASKKSQTGKPNWSISLAQPLLECHYSVNGAFLEEPLINHVDRIRHIPCIGVQGRLDFVCPLQTAYDLSQAWPEMELHVVPMSGHSMYDPGMKHALVEATDFMKKYTISSFQ